MRTATRWITIAWATFASVFLGCGGESVDAVPLVSADQPLVIDQDQSVVSRSGVLVFRNEMVFQETLERLSGLDAESLREWNLSMGIISLREVFNEVIKAENEIDEYYEHLTQSGPEKVRLVPREPVHSQVYLRARQEGRIRVISDEAGEYFDYNIREVYLAPVLDPDGRVAVGGVLMQYVPGGVKRTPYMHLDEIEQAKVSLANVPAVLSTPLAVSSPFTNGIPQTKASWRFSSSENTEWTYDGKRRYRAWVEGSSYTEWGTDLYVSNVLRIEGMKKNFWGNWGHLETYTAYVNLAWYWNYLWGGSYHDFLPVPATSATSPLSWSSSYVNNAALSLSPHINGYYGFSCTSCATVEPVIVHSVGGTVVIDGHTLYPGSFEIITTE